MRLLRSQQLTNKKVLLVDKETKTKNDRTWCFWEDKEGFFEEVVHRKWDTISFLSDDFSAPLAIAPYQYKMIRGINFFNYCFTEIAKHSHIEVVVADVNKVWKEQQTGFIVLNDQQFSLGEGVTIFSSIIQPSTPKKNTIKLLQHFKGWIIEAKEDTFVPEQATMMDFRVHQQHGTTFAYVLPFNSKTALVEYTLFTKKLLNPGQYEEELRSYISTFLNIQDYTITEEEFGIIPMTNEKFPFYDNGVFYIGTAGGQTKGSSGYTFQFIQKQSQQIANHLLSGKSLLALPRTHSRFRFYDNTLLDILYHDKLPGAKIFSRLFKKNKPQLVLRFLDNETSFKEELKIMSSLPTWPFLKAGLKQL